MDFIDQLKQFSKRVESLKESIQTEEATKTALIMPFFSMLGYDVFNPQEFVPEFTADVGIKKGEKVDYAIMKDGCPAILIECKSINEGLERHDSQLFRYFSTVAAKFAILAIFYSFLFIFVPNYSDFPGKLLVNSDLFLLVSCAFFLNSQQKCNTVTMAELSIRALPAFSTCQQRLTMLK